MPETTRCRHGHRITLPWVTCAMCKPYPEGERPLDRSENLRWWDIVVSDDGRDLAAAFARRSPKWGLAPGESAEVTIDTPSGPVQGTISRDGE